MSRPLKEIPLVTKIAKAFAEVERLQRNGTHPRGFRFTRAHDVFDIVRAKLFDRGIIVCPVEGTPVYVPIQTNGGDAMTECRLQVTYTFQDANGKLDPPLVINGLGRSVGEEALEIAQTKTQKALLKRFGIMADEQDDGPIPSDESEAGETIDDAAPMRNPKKRREQLIREFEIRAIEDACADTGKQPPEISEAMLTRFKTAELANLKRFQFKEALAWASNGAGTLAPKPQAAPALQGSLPLPRPAPSFEMRVGGKTHVIEPKTGSYSI